MLNENQSDNNVAESEVVSRMGIEGDALTAIVLRRTLAFSSADGQPSNPVHRKIIPLAKAGRA